MMEWILGIGVWCLLAAAAYLFFRSKFKAVREAFGEDMEDDFAEDCEAAGEPEEFGESAGADASEGVWEGDYRREAYRNEGYCEENFENAEYQNADYENAEYQNADYENAEYQDADYVNTEYQSVYYENADCRDAGYPGGNTWADEIAPPIYFGETASQRNRRAEVDFDDRYAEAGQNKHKKKEKRKSGIFGRLAVLLLFAGAVYFLLPYCCVRREMTIAAGEKCPDVRAFLKWGNDKARYASMINEGTVLDRAGDYGVIIEVYGKKVAAVLHVAGVAQPHIATKNVTIFCGESVEADDFVEEVEGITPVDIRFAEEPDCAAGGIVTVLLEIEDEAGDVTTAEAVLEVIDDTEPPVILGISELNMVVGGSVSYKKGVTVTDNYDQNVRLEVDSSAVNVDKAGDYRVIYNAVDSAGNRTSVSTVLHVAPMTIDTVTEEGIYAEADKLLGKLLTDSMSQYEQAEAIYNWCHENIAYSDGTPKTDWVQGAYRGLVDRKGDCYVYAATAKCLLTRAGIKNMDIEKIPAKSEHYWNLIDIGDGWRHFDTCRRKDGSTFFYKTDAELMEYSNAHNKSHNYDRSLYPDIG